MLSSGYGVQAALRRDWSPTMFDIDNFSRLWDEGYVKVSGGESGLKYFAREGKFTSLMWPDCMYNPSRFGFKYICGSPLVAYITAMCGLWVSAALVPSSVLSSRRHGCHPLGAVGRAMPSDDAYEGTHACH